MLDLTADLSYDAVGGLTLGADPVAAAMLHAAAARRSDRWTRSWSARRARRTACSAGSRARTSPGAGCWPSRTPARPVARSLTAVEALREAGADVVAVAVIVDRDTGARERIEAEGLPYLRGVLGRRRSAWPDARLTG